MYNRGFNHRLTRLNDLMYVFFNKKSERKHKPVYFI